MVERNTEVKDFLRVVLRLVDLYLYRTAPDTTTDTITTFLEEKFSEVSCEALQSKHPHSYTSFRIKVFEKKLQKLMDPKLWPEDAYI